MLEKKDCFFFGKITRIFGYKDGLLFYTEVENPGLYLSLESIYIDMDGRLVPFFFEELKLHKNNIFICKFKNVDTPEAVKALVDRNLYLPFSLLPPEKAGNFSRNVQGYKVVDQNKGEIGVAGDVLDLQQHSLLIVKQGNKEIMVPVVDEILVKVDRRRKLILINAPEGLIDLYL